MDQSKSQTQGFTIIELMMVLSIIAILSALVSVPVRSFIARLEVKSAARHMYGDLYYAKLQAIREMVPHTFITNVDNNGTYYWMVIEDSDGDGQLDPSEKTKKKYYLSNVINFASGIGLNVTFDQQGLADNAYTYSLKSSKIENYSVNVTISPIGFISLK